MFSFTVLYTLILAVSTFLLAVIGVFGLTRILPLLSVMDAPNERSNHTEPVPRGGGLAVIIASLCFLIVGGAHSQLIFAIIALMLISIMDDVKPQPVKIRLAAQGMAALLVVLGFDGMVFQGLLPLALDRAVSVILLVGFINFYNFMDGIDELTSVQTVSIAAGLLAVVASEHSLPNYLAIDGIIVAAAVAGFWIFNRHPAKIFLGDVGSIPLGLIMGYLLLKLATEGQWAAALILPAYYLSDAGLTLLARLGRGEKIWQAHSSHAYQSAVRNGLPHDEVSHSVLALNMFLIVYAVASQLGEMEAIASVGMAYMLSFLLMAWFKGARPVRRATVTKTDTPEAEVMPPYEARA